MISGLLRSVFAAKRNFAQGHSGGRRVLDGIEVAPLLRNAPSAFSISADFELAWAWRELDDESRDRRALRERENFEYILDLLDSRRVAITWATVGHMFLSACTRTTGEYPHPDMPRPINNRRWSGDWYRHDPCSSAREAPLWYGPDLIDRIQRSLTPHELASHSFSHIEYSAECCSTELAEAEMRACIEVMEARGVRCRSLVYPFNIMGHHHLPALGQLGLCAVRHRDRQIRLAYPERTSSGVYKVCESLNLRLPRWYDYVDKFEIFNREAARRNAVVHLWFHPSDELEVFVRSLAPIVDRAARLRDEGLLWIATMSELAAYAEARRTAQLTAVWEQGSLIVKIDDGAYDRSRYGPTEITLIIPLPKPPVTAAMECGPARSIVPTTAVAGESGRYQVTFPFASSVLRLEC